MTSRLRQTLSLALPIMGGMISQNIMNLVDTAMLGVLGDEALASVGLGPVLNLYLRCVHHRFGNRRAGHVGPLAGSWALG